MDSLIRFFLLLGLTIGLPATVSAAPFTPQMILISAPLIVQYNFDGSNLTVPFTLSGRPATVMFAVFTRNRSHSMGEVQNGYLGWHTVDMIDTCVYLSPPDSYIRGNNTVSWNGRDDDGAPLPPGNYTYYLWGYDAETPARKATNALRLPRFDRSHIQTRGQDGQPLANPVFFDAPAMPSVDQMQRIVRTKWVLGADPDDFSFAETTAYTGWAEHSRLALDSADHSRFFVRTETDHGAQIRKFRWVPNGDAELLTGWANGGSMEINGTSYRDAPGLAANETGLLFFATFTGGGEDIAYENEIVIMDADDGAIIRSLHPLPPTPGQSGLRSILGGIMSLDFGGDMLFANSPLSCLALMIDPYTEDAADCVRWSNGNGDHTADKNDLPDSPDPWDCIDSEHAPWYGPIAPDANRFALFPAEDMGDVSFGLFLPDGTGAGYFQLPGMSGGTLYGLRVVDSGSAFDGLYYGGVNADGDSAGVWFTGYDVFKGTIVGVGTVDTTIRMVTPPPSTPLQPGATFTVAWDRLGSDPITDPVRLSFSSDDRQTWTALADSLAATGKINWIIPALSSSKCWLRISNAHSGGPYDTWGPFTISGQVGVSGDTPRAFGLRPNTPNPFNPSTTLSFTLPAPGNISLTVYDVTGRKVTELFRGFFTAGEHSAVWNAKGCASGMYFAVLKAGERSQTRKMLLVR